MKFQHNDLVMTDRGLGIVEQPMEHTCHIRLSPKVNPDAKPPCEFIIRDNDEIEKVDHA